MTSRFGKTGAALLAALALSAFAASAAQASKFATEKGAYPAAVTGVGLTTQILKVHVTTGSNNEIRCTGLAMSGTLAAASSALTVHPEYTGCTAFGVNAIVSTTNCNYVFNSGTEITADEFNGSLNIECGAGQSISVVTAECEIRITPQNGLTGLLLIDSTTGGSVLGKFFLTSFAYTVSKDGPACPLTGLENRVDGTYKTGEYKFTATVGGVTEKIRVE